MSKAQKQTLTRADNIISDILGQLEEVRDDWQGIYDERSEKWQESDAGEAALSNIEYLDSAIDSLGEALSALNTIDV